MISDVCLYYLARGWRKKNYLSKSIEILRGIRIIASKVEDMGWQAMREHTSIRSKLAYFLPISHGKFRSVRHRFHAPPTLRKVAIISIAHQPIMIASPLFLTPRTHDSSASASSNLNHRYVATQSIQPKKTRPANDILVSRSPTCPDPP